MLDRSPEAWRPSFPRRRPLSPHRPVIEPFLPMIIRVTIAIPNGEIHPARDGRVSQFICEPCDGHRELFSAPAVKLPRQLTEEVIFRRLYMKIILR